MGIFILKFRKHVLYSAQRTTSARVCHQRGATQGGR